MPENRRLPAMLFVLAMCSTTILAQWNRVEALPATDIYALAASGDTILAGGDGYVYISLNKGLNWLTSNAVGNNSPGVEAVTAHGGYIYAGTISQGVFRSSDSGQTWQAVNDGLSGAGSLSISDFASIPSGLYASTYGAGIFYLQNSQSQWTALSSNYPYATAGTVQTLAVNNDTLLAGAGANGQVYLLAHPAAAWEEAPLIPPLVPGLSVTDLEVVGNNIFAGVFDIDFRGIYPTVFRSADGGHTWTPANNGLPLNTSVVKLAYSDPAIFAAANRVNSFKLFVSQNEGQSWQEVGNFLGPVLYKLAISGENCFAARLDGLWYAPVSLLPVVPENKDVFPDKIELRQNYPNPFNPVTTIGFSLPQPGFVTLKIYAISGEEISTLIAENLTVGDYRRQWLAGEIASGVYFYKLTVSGHSLTGKALYLK